MANGQENLIPINERTTDEQREIRQKGGIASGEARRKKRDLRERARLINEQMADPRVAAAMSRTGIDIEDNADVVLAGILKGVIKGDIKSIDRWMELTGENARENERHEIRMLEGRKKELEAERAAMENELYRLRLDAIKGIGQDELPDDGFLEALKGTAAEDWSDEVL